jgi:hypothetical protein
VNFVVPSGLAPGQATVTTYSSEAARSPAAIGLGNPLDRTDLKGCGLIDLVRTVESKAADTV